MHKIRNFHEGHNTVGEWQGNGMVCVNRPLTRQGNGIVCVNRPMSSLVLFSVPAVFHVYLSLQATTVDLLEAAEIKRSTNKIWGQFHIRCKAHTALCICVYMWV
jgi:hypothetical protein